MSTRSTMRPVVAFLTILSLILAPVSQAADLSLPGGDFIAPQIQHDPLVEFPGGAPVRIYARATDNVAVTEVTLFYRTTPSGEFRRVRMHSAPGRDMFMAEVDAGAGSLVQYYIQACDAAQNCTLRGAAFDPIGVAIVEPVTAPTPVATPPSATSSGGGATAAKPTAEKSGVSKWVWVGLGVLAVGGVAMALGGGGGDDDPATATVSVTAPLP